MEDEKQLETKTELIDADKYLKTGCHIGNRFKSGEMRRYVYRVRKDGLIVMNVETLDKKIKAAAKFLTQFEPEKIVVVARRLYAYTPVKMFAESIGAKCFVGRFVPGTFTNPNGKEFVEPGVVVVTETEPDMQAIDEATKIKVPVVALCSTNNTTKNTDLIIPINNRGRKSLALVYWLLAREYLKERGEISKNEEFKKEMDDFEYKIKEGDKLPEEDYGSKLEEATKKQAGRGKFGQTGRGRFGRDRRQSGREKGRGRERKNYYT